MKATLIRINAQNSAGDPLPLLLASLDRRELCHSGGETWWPAIARLPALRYDFFGGAFDGQVTAPSAEFTLAYPAIPGFDARVFADARLQIWHGELADVGTGLALLFDGRVTGEPAKEQGLARFTASVDDGWQDEPLLPTYAGTGGLEGGADLQGQVKPLVIGACRFVPGVLLDPVNNVYQVSFGSIHAVTAAYDRVAKLTAAGDCADLAALIAAEIPEGSYATCLALGLVRLGAPPDGKISFDVSGSNAGTGGFVRKPGAVIARIAELAEGTVDTANLAALDVACPWNLARVFTNQTTPRQAIQELADSIGACAGTSWTGVLFVQPLAIGTPEATLASDGSALPPVARVSAQPMAAPYWRLATEAEITWQVYELSEVAFTATIVDRGLYDAATTYREGNIVSSPDRSRWIYTNATAGSGNAPPSWPTASNAHWANIEPPATASDLTYEDGTTIEALKPAEPGATEGAPPGTPVGDRPAEQVTSELDQHTAQIAAAESSIAEAEGDIQSLFDVYGDTESAAQSAAAALASKNAAEAAEQLAGQHEANALLAEQNAEAAEAAAEAAEAGATDQAGIATQQRQLAETARADAQGFRNEAFTAKEDAEGAAATASTQAGISASAASSAKEAAIDTVPRGFSSGGDYFTSDLYAPLTGGTAPWTFQNGYAEEVGSSGYLVSRGRRTLPATGTIRATVESAFPAANSAGTAGQTDRLYIALYDSNDSYLAPSVALAAGPSRSVGETFVSLSRETSVASLLAAHPSAVYYRVRYQPSDGAGLINFNGTVRLRTLWADDATSLKQAEDAATASIASAATATAKASEAEQSASAANTSAANAETARGQAQSFRNEAVAARDDAQGYASTATQQAGIATSAADDAGGSADAAASAASTATTKATEAEGYAATASTQAGISVDAKNDAETAASVAEGHAASASADAASAASSEALSAAYRDGARQAAIDVVPRALTTGSDAYFTNDLNAPLTGGVGAWTFHGGYARLASFDRLMPRGKKLLPETGTIRVVVENRFTASNTAGTAGQRDRLMLALYDANDNYIIGPSVLIGPSRSSSGGYEQIMGDISVASIKASWPNARFYRARYEPGDGSGAQAPGFNGAVQLKGLWAEDVTAIKTAEAQAGIATSEAASASADAAEALADRQLTAQYRSDTLGYRNSAQSYAGISEDEAAIATAQAAAAQQSAVLSASLAGGTFNRDPGFDDWPVGAALPASWIGVGMPATVTRVVDARGGTSLRVSDNTSNAYLYQFYDSEAIAPGSWIVIEGEVTNNSGSLSGSGVVVRLYPGDMSTPYITQYDLRFATDKPVGEGAPGAGTAGRTYVFSKLVKVSSDIPQPRGIRIFAFINNSNVGTPAAKDITLRRAGFRFATDMEVQAGTALPVLEASVSSQGQVLQDLDTSFASLENTVQAQGVTVNQHTQAITQVVGDITTMAGRWGASIDVNGRVVGSVKLDGSASYSSFTVASDKFAVENPSGGAGMTWTTDANGRPTLKVDDGAGSTVEIGWCP